MRNAFFFLLIAVFGSVQVAFPEHLKFFGVKPDLLLVISVFAGFNFSLRWAVLFSLFAGLFKDSFLLNPYPLNTVMFITWSFLIAQLAKKIVIENIVMRLALGFIIGILHNIVCGLALVYSGVFIPIGIFTRIVVLGGIICSVLIPAVAKINQAVSTLAPLPKEKDEQD